MRPERDEDLDAWPRVLVISNNPLSLTSNNGKTLASLFQEFPGDCVSQLYFASELPSGRPEFRYYRTWEGELLRGLASRQIEGSPVKAVRRPLTTLTVDRGGVQLAIRVRALLKGSHLARLLREALWLRRDVAVGGLGEWLRESRPELIFFCAGDGLFAYGVAERVRALTGATLAIFVTDDYILKGRWKSPLGSLRRRMVFSRMQKLVRTSAGFFTISPKMRVVYRETFGRDSAVIGNVTQPLRLPVPSGAKDGPRLVYAGSLHSGRSGVLAQLATAIASYNSTRPSGGHAFLEVFTGTPLGRRDREHLNKPGVCRVSPLLLPEAYQRAVNRADILVHVESFEKPAIAATKLSLSTKIPEYLSVGKPILAIGPGEISSMEYLASVAYCVLDMRELPARVCALLDDTALQDRLGLAALDHYGKHHSPEVVLPEFYRHLQRALASNWP